MSDSGRRPEVDRAAGVVVQSLRLDPESRHSDSDRLSAGRPRSAGRLDPLPVGGIDWIGPNVWFGQRN